MESFTKNKVLFCQKKVYTLQGRSVSFSKKKHFKKFYQSSMIYKGTLHLVLGYTIGRFKHIFV